MKKSSCILLMLLFFLSLSGCNGFKADKTKSVSNEPGVAAETNIKQSIPHVVTDTVGPGQADSGPAISEPADTESTAPGSSIAKTTEPEPKALEPANKTVLIPGLHTYEVKAHLHESMPEYRFVATGKVLGPDEWMLGYVMGLNAYDENGNCILSADFSEISDDGEVVGYHVFNEMMDTMGLHVTDVNFDGYKDVVILNTFAGAHANTWYDCWLWDTKISSFVKSESFSEICNPALDAEKKCIYSAGGSGAAYWGGRIYKFIDGEFILTNELDADENGLVERASINGKIRTVREVNFRGDSELLEREREHYRKSELWQLDHPRWYWVGGHHADQWLD